MCTEKRNFTNFSFLQEISGLGKKKAKLPQIK